MKNGVVIRHLPGSDPVLCTIIPVTVLGSSLGKEASEETINNALLTLMDDYVKKLKGMIPEFQNAVFHRYIMETHDFSYPGIVAAI